ncbi:hypothetical protein [Microvirga arabica]|uniref:hypothetical protein n=1 Tax=Microvirga arabica TaxID=1128671 RepID=UPI0036735B3E
MAALDRMEILDFHGPHATFTHEAEASLQVENFNAIVRACQKASRELLAFRCGLAGQLQLKLTHDSLSKRRKRFSLLFGETLRTRDIIENAEHPKGQALLRSERNSRVEGQAGRTFNLHSILETWVEAQIRDDEESRLHDGMIADRVFPGCLRELHASPGFEPLPMLVEEGDTGDGRIADLSCQLRDVVELNIRCRIQNVEVPERSETFDFLPLRQIAGTRML